MLKGGVAKFVFEGVNEVDVGESFSGESFKSEVDLEAGWRECVVWAVGIMKHGTDGIGEAIGREATEGKAYAGDFFEVAVCCLILTRKIVVDVE